MPQARTKSSEPWTADAEATPPGMATINGGIDGYLDLVSPIMIAGWAKAAASDAPLEIDVCVDGVLVGRTLAGHFRPGLQEAGLGNGRHGFAMKTPLRLFDGAEHAITARVSASQEELKHSPRAVRFGDLRRYSGAIGRSLLTDPWIIDRVGIDGKDVTLNGWALAPGGDASLADFRINDQSFDSVAWPQPRGDIEQLYFFHPGARSAGFTLRKRLDDLDEIEELSIRFVDRSSGASLASYQDYRFPLRDRADNLPDTDRRVRVMGSADPQLFQLGGYTLARKIENLACGVYKVPLGRVLDWGCGCGRLTRYLSRFSEVFGADIDADNASWCSANLGIAASAVALTPPMPYAAGFFDLVVGNSVFTHLDESMQNLWLSELARVMKPGGVAMVSIQSIADLPRETFDPRQYEQLLVAGFLSDSVDDALKGQIADSDYYRATYHTHEYVRAVWRRYFEILDIIPQFSNNMQDMVVMRRRAP